MDIEELNKNYPFPWWLDENNMDHSTICIKDASDEIVLAPKWGEDKDLLVFLVKTINEHWEEYRLGNR